MASSVIVGTRARLQMTFKRDIGDGNGPQPFDPQVILFTSTFTPGSVGLPQTKEALQYGVDADVVRLSQGIYYVQRLLDTIGTLKFTYRSTAWGEELNMEEICKVAARSVIE